MDALFYDPRINRFIDEDGTVLHDLKPLLDGWQLDSWKKDGGYSDYIIAKNGNIMELLYFIDDETMDLDELYRDDSGGSKLDKILY